MLKTPAMFQNNQWKTVRGVAPTRYPLSVHFDSISCQKSDLVHTAEQERKNNPSIISNPHAHHKAEKVRKK